MSPIPEAALSGRYWPVCPGPLPDELLTSWLVRLARANGQKLHTFCTLAWPGKEVWNRDPDKFADPEIVATLARRTGTDPERAWATTLAAYAGRLYLRHNPAGSTRWLTNVGVRHRLRHNAGFQFCPRCLATDAQPYYRRRWRLSLVTLCEAHGCLLLDRCPRCEAVVNFHRGELGQKERVEAAPLTDCHACGFDLRAAEAPPVGDAAMAAFQAWMLEGVERGWFEDITYSHLYFDALARVLTVLASRHRLCRDAGAAVWARMAPPGAEPLPALARRGERAYFDARPVGERHDLLRLARWLLDEWPGRFVGFCRERRLWSSAFLRDFPDAPFWFWSVVQEHLYVVHSPWKEVHPDSGHGSYAAHVRGRLPSNGQRAGLERRLAFLRAHPWLWHTPKRLALAMRRAGLYGARTHHSQIVPRCAPLIVEVLRREAAADPASVLLAFTRGAKFELLDDRRPEKGFRVSAVKRNYRAGLVRSAEWARRHPKVLREGHGNTGRTKFAL